MDLQSLVPETFQQMMQASLTIILWLICGALLLNGQDLPDWMIAILTAAMFYWFPNKTASSTNGNGIRPTYQDK